MASGITKSAKTQVWSRDERERQMSFVRGFIQLLNNKQPRTALAFARDNNITLLFPREPKPEPEGLRVLRELNAFVQEAK